MGSSMTTSLENPLSSLSSGYFSDSTSFKVKPTIEDIQGSGCNFGVRNTMALLNSMGLMGCTELNNF